MQIEIEITDLSRAGSGVGKDSEGRIIFVPFTAPGDRVKVEITRQSKTYSEGKVIEIITKSHHRVAPPCPVFGSCGGCQWQHISYELEWSTKTHGVLHALKRAGVATETNMPPLESFPAEKLWGYRNRIQLRGEGARAGYYERGSHQLVPIEKCEIAQPEINAALARFLKNHPPSEPYKIEFESTERGVTQSLNQKHAALGFEQINPEQNKKIKDWIASQIPENVTVLDLFGGNGNFSLPLLHPSRQIYCVDTSPQSKPLGISEKTPFIRIKQDVAQWLSTQKTIQKAEVAILDPPRMGLGPKGKEMIQALQRLKVELIFAIGCDVDAWIKDLLKYQKENYKIEKIALFDLFPRTTHLESIALLRSIK